MIAFLARRGRLMYLGGNGFYWKVATQETRPGLIELRRGELDVAVMVISNLRDRMALQAEILEVSPYRLWLPLGHRLASADFIGINDIAAEPLIMLTIDEIEENTGKLLTALGARPHVAFRTRSVEAVRSLVATGAGVTILSDMVYRPWSLEGDKLESREVSAQIPTMDVGLAWSRSAELSAPARAFIEFCRMEFLSGNPRSMTL